MTQPTGRPRGRPKSAPHKIIFARVLATLADRLEHQAARCGITPSQATRDAVTVWVAQKEKEERDEEFARRLQLGMRFTSSTRTDDTTPPSTLPLDDNTVKAGISVLISNEKEDTPPDQSPVSPLISNSNEKTATRRKTAAEARAAAARALKAERDAKAEWPDELTSDNNAREGEDSAVPGADPAPGAVPDFDDKKYRLGKPCSHGHTWPGTSQGLLRKFSNACVGCTSRLPPGPVVLPTKPSLTGL